jgi:hypothetical protein
MVGEYGDVPCTSRLYLQDEGLHGGISTEGESSSLVEDAPATIELTFKDNHGNCLRNSSGRGLPYGSVGPTTVEDLGKAHRMHEVVNNHQEEHHSIVLKTSGTVTDQTLRFDRSWCY